MNTMEKIDSRVEKFYTDHLLIGNDKWLVFERKCYYNNTDSEAIEVFLVDKALQTRTLLGVWFDSRWTSPNNYLANQMWSAFKPHTTVIKKIVKNLRTSLKNYKPFVMEWNCLKRRFRLESIKVKRKLR